MPGFLIHHRKLQGNIHLPGLPKSFISLGFLLNVSPFLNRLTFWLSNSILLRAIISQAVDKLQLSAGPNVSSRGGGKGLGERSSLKQCQSSLLVEKKNNAVEYFDDWEDPQTFVVALENVETWIFNRITESVWWQVKFSLSSYGVLSHRKI